MGRAFISKHEQSFPMHRRHAKLPQENQVFIRPEQASDGAFRVTAEEAGESELANPSIQGSRLGNPHALGNGATAPIFGGLDRRLAPNGVAGEIAFK